MGPEELNLRAHTCQRILISMSLRGIRWPLLHLGHGEIAQIRRGALRVGLNCRLDLGIGGGLRRIRNDDAVPGCGGMEESPLDDIGCLGERLVGVRDEVDFVLPRLEAHLQAVVWSWEWLDGRELGLEPGDNAGDDRDSHGHSLTEMVSAEARVAATWLVDLR